MNGWCGIEFLTRPVLPVAFWVAMMIERDLQRHRRARVCLGVLFTDEGHNLLRGLLAGPRHQHAPAYWICNMVVTECWIEPEVAVIVIV